MSFEDNARSMDNLIRQRRRVQVTKSPPHRRASPIFRTKKEATRSLTFEFD